MAYKLEALFGPSHSGSSRSVNGTKYRLPPQLTLGKGLYESFPVLDLMPTTTAEVGMPSALLLGKEVLSSILWAAPNWVVIQCLLATAL